MDPLYPLFPVLSFICFILVLAPLPLHLTMQSVGTLMFIVWTASACLISFINSIVWHNNAIDWAPVYCDIFGRIMLGFYIASPSCCLCIQRRLYFITSAETPMTCQKEKRRTFIIDLCIALGFPVFMMAFAYLAQGNRYRIYEDIGCIINIYNVWPAYPVYYMWPLVISMISLVYSLLTFHAFVKRRAQVNDCINSDEVTFRRYFRLMLLASTEIIFFVPISATALYLTSRDIQPYISWENTHAHFDTRFAYPSIIWRNNQNFRLLLELFHRWIVVISAVFFISFFTFTKESRRTYSSAFAIANVFSRWNILSRMTRYRPRNQPRVLRPFRPSVDGDVGGHSTFLPVFRVGNPTSNLTSTIMVDKFATIDEKENARSDSLDSPRTGAKPVCFPPPCPQDGQGRPTDRHVERKQNMATYCLGY
ncbi:STE3-domain-containing protein [Rickenella mellea]|uniref:STE3-domain-containing protein n=1 Tax=Rickenella mellea TaxID=50990 RepID=A0A4Y7PWQ4_9AGAM|nr:STE3-domain-containing protein [Rickenella mellea]